MTDKWFTRQWRGLLTFSFLFIPFLTVQGQDVTTDKPTSVPMQTIQVAKNKLPADGGVVLQGTVKDEDGEPLIGVTVFVRETKTGAMTDYEGKFKVMLPAGKVSNVAFSYVGMKPLTKTYDGKHNHEGEVIVMEDNGKLDEVVVTGLFDYKSSTFTGSTTIIVNFLFSINILPSQIVVS
ncbi:MAG: carboxypeptidase-like regulatory domain-containing protein, partial [Bacteroidaceae bacterium]